MKIRLKNLLGMALAADLTLGAIGVYAEETSIAIDKDAFVAFGTIA